MSAHPHRIKPDFDILLSTFGVEETRESELIAQFVQAEWSLDEFDVRTLKRQHQKALSDADSRNEEEPKMNLLAFLFDLADLSSPKRIKPFYERTITATVPAKDDAYFISQKVDYMLATPIGKGTPGVPYFFMQEFEKEKGEKSDAEGLLLAAMLAAVLAATATNNNDKPLYGGYINGRMWFFAIFTQQVLHISRPFIATNHDDLAQSVAILRKVKTLILHDYPLPS